MACCKKLHQQGNDFLHFSCSLIHILEAHFLLWRAGALIDENDCFDQYNHLRTPRVTAINTNRQGHEYNDKGKYRSLWIYSQTSLFLMQQKIASNCLEICHQRTLLWKFWPKSLEAIFKNSFLLLKIKKIGKNVQDVFGSCCQKQFYVVKNRKTCLATRK